MEERTLPRYPAGKRELIFGLLVLLFGTFTWNSILYGGFCLGFALGAVALTGCSFWYLLRCGFRPGKYEAALMILAAAIFAGFARSSDGDTKALLLRLMPLKGLEREMEDAIRREDYEYAELIKQEMATRNKEEEEDYEDLEDLEKEL